MKKVEFTKIIAITLIEVSVLLLNPICASAEWRQDPNGWWNTEGSSYSIGWRLIDGKWYYFGHDGYMEHDTLVDGYQLSSDGVWIQSIKNSSTEDEKVTNSTDIKSEFSSEGITMKLEKSEYELGTKQIKFYITNNTNKVQGCGPSYAVARFENNMWHILTEFTKSFDKQVVVSPKDTEEGTVSLNVLKGFNQFKPGRYKILTKINSTDFTLEFELKEKLVN